MAGALGLDRKTVTTDLPDREAARDFAIEMAEASYGSRSDRRASASS